METLTPDAQKHFKDYYFKNEDNISLQSAFAEGIRYAEQTKTTDKICGDCNKFVPDGVEFPELGKCMIGEYYRSKKKSDICDNTYQFKKRKI